MNRITDRERDLVLEVLRAEFHTSTSGFMVRRLEQEFAKKFGVRYAVAHVNGTATLHSALVAAGVGHGDEVIVPPLTMASTSFAVLQAGARPVFADVDPDTFCIDPSSIGKHVTARTRAIIPVALYGLSPDMDAIMAIASEHDLVVIEDDAQCFLGRYKGRLVGTIGHMASFSFQSSKHMTSGEGGMLVTNDEALADKARRFGSLGYAAVKAEQGHITKDVIQDPRYERHASLGWNYRMPDLCAAVALAQLERLEDLVQQRIRVAAMYSDALKGCSWLIPQRTPEKCVHSYWTFVVRLENDNRLTWYDFRKKYQEFGGDGIYAAWQLTYLEPAFRQLSSDYERGLCPVAEDLQPRILQFKTNYFDEKTASRKVEALSKTIAYFDRM